MSFYYVRSTTGSDSNNGASWALAKQTITGALNVAASGDTVYVSHVHDYYVASAISYPSSKGTASAPILVICVNDAQEPPTQLATTAIENNLSAGVDVGFNRGSNIYWYGINFKSGRHIVLPHGCTQVFDSCNLQLTSTTQGVWNTDTGQLGADDWTFFDIRFINTKFQAAYTGSNIYIYPNHSTSGSAVDVVYNLFFKGCTVSGVSITNFMTFPGSYPHMNVIADSCDFSILGTGCTLFDNGTMIVPSSKFSVRNCKLHPNVNIFSSAIVNPNQPDFFIENCDSEGTNNRSEFHSFQGSVKTTNETFRTGGAIIGTAGYSYVMVANNNVSRLQPLVSQSMSLWCDTIGTVRTISVPFLHDNINQIGNNELWGEVEYQGSAISPITSFSGTRLNNYPLASAIPTNYPIDTGATWTAPDVTNPNCQKIQIQFTPQMQGLVNVKVYLARSNYPIYIDPKIVLS
jgi:hypothetical protein